MKALKNKPLHKSVLLRGGVFDGKTLPILPQTCFITVKPFEGKYIRTDETVDGLEVWRWRDKNEG